MMDNENVNEESIEKKNIIDKDAVKNLTSNLMKNENSLDLNSIMQLTSTLLKNDTLLNSVTELSNKKKNSILPVSKATEQIENKLLSSLSQKLENIANDISELKQEIKELSSLSQKLEIIAHDLSDLKEESKVSKRGNFHSKIFTFK
jgi:hypothetical protein